MRNLTGYLTLAAVAAVGYLAWRAHKQGVDLASSVTAMVDQTRANLTSAWRNNVTGPIERGQQIANGTLYEGSKAWLYSDYGYTGVDAATGQPVIEGEWYSDAVARRYEAEQRARGAAPAATSIHGAAFGIYPRP